jgi:1-acyl-sn-glycerol-3-phosphate acyltransferase
MSSGNAGATGSSRSRREDPARESVPLYVIRHFAQLLLRLTFRLRVLGTENLPANGPVLLAGNHSGFLDGPIVMIMLPRPSAFLVKSELYSGPLRRVLNFARQIPIHRGTPDRAALRAALDVLAGGGVLGVFPEGTRGTGDLATIQHGIGYLALRGMCPVVPVVCKGTANALPKGKIFPRWRAPIEVIFGPSFTIDVTGDPRARTTIADAAEQVRTRLLDHLTSQAIDEPGSNERQRE